MDCSIPTCTESTSVVPIDNHNNKDSKLHHSYILQRLASSSSPPPFLIVSSTVAFASECQEGIRFTLWNVRANSAPRFVITLPKLHDSVTNWLRRGTLVARTELPLPLLRLSDSWTASPNPMFIFATTVHHCYVGPRLMPLTSGQSFSAPDMPHPTGGVPRDMPSEPLPTFLEWRHCQPYLACVPLLFRIFPIWHSTLLSGLLQPFVCPTQSTGLSFCTRMRLPVFDCSTCTRCGAKQGPKTCQASKDTFCDHSFSCLAGHRINFHHTMHDAFGFMLQTAAYIQHPGGLFLTSSYVIKKFCPSPSTSPTTLQIDAHSYVDSKYNRTC